MARLRPIYLDYHSTTPADHRVAAVVAREMAENFGNPQSDDHVFGTWAASAIEAAAEHLALLIGGKSSQVRFTSGATSAVEAVFAQFAEVRSRIKHSKLRVGISAVEHTAVLSSCARARSAGEFDLVEFRVDGRGRIDLDHLAEKCRDGLDVVCVMFANNEVGNIFPVQHISSIAHEHGAIFITDATQAVGKIPINMQDQEIDILICSAHKFYGPKGVGAVVVRSGLPFTPIHSSGTPNVAGVAGMGEAARLRVLERDQDEQRVGELRDRLQELLVESIAGVVVNGDLKNRLAGNLHFSVPDIPNKAVVARIRDRLALSTGSACRSGIEAPSHVLMAMGLPTPQAEGAFRLGLGKFTTPDEVEEAADILKEAISSTRGSLRQ